MYRSFIFWFFLLAPFYSFGQAQRDPGQIAVSVQAKRQMPAQILADLGRQTGTSISYNASDLKLHEITITADSIPIKTVIDSVFRKKNLKLRLIGDHQLVVYESAEEPLNLDTCYRTVSAVLVDGFTEQALARVSVKELQTNQLTVTNRDGKFLIKVPCDLEHVQLEISAIGYRSRFINQRAGDALDVIVLQGDYLTLKEVYILSVHAEKLMEEVLNGVCDHYMNSPARATSFFREAILKNNKMVVLSEAVFDVYSQSYTSPNKKDQVQLVKGRKYTDHRNLDTLVFKVKGSLRSCFELDVVKHQPYFFDLNFYRQTYDYSFNTIVEYNGRDVYVIDFKRKPMATGLPYEGKMFIDKKLKSLVSLEFELNRRSLGNTENYFVIKKSRGVKIKLQNARYHVHYTDVEGKLAMNYASFTSSFKVRRKNSLFADKYETISEYAVNKFRPDDVSRIRAKDSFAAEKIFMDQPMEYSDSYWQGVNFLPLEKSLLEASAELQKIISEK